MENEELFFCGEFQRTLDAQLRLALPSEWCAADGSSHLVLFPGRDCDLLLFPFAMFREFLLKARSGALADASAQMALAQIGRVVRDVRPDKQRRFKLEREMLDAIGAKEQLTLVGAVTHIKICAPGNWHPAQMKEAGSFLDEVQKLNAGSTDWSDFFGKLAGKSGR